MDYYHENLSLNALENLVAENTTKTKMLLNQRKTTCVLYYCCDLNLMTLVCKYSEYLPAHQK